MSMPRSGADHAEDGPMEIRLHRQLYRVDCPQPQQLGEWHLQLLAPEDALAVAQHVRDCELCRGEVDLLREYLRQSLAPGPSLRSAVRRVIAQLVLPATAPAVAALRGETARRPVHVYEADDVTITIGPGQSSVDLIGLVMATRHAPEDLMGQPVRLIGADASPRVSELDDIGNFAFDGLTPGPVTIEVCLPDATVVVEGVGVG